ncbi:MAG: hypothetical protein INQ03_21435 [Candidatus Heimdallarchaeota archaeon]|nr:hypothetical protein [Candidatus Heimdallarchaeota archaeon]
MDDVTDVLKLELQLYGIELSDAQLESIFKDYPQSLFLDSLDLTLVPMRSINSIQPSKLYLTNNKLNLLPDFSTLIDLEDLFLTWNEIEKIDETSRLPGNLRLLSLKGNKITNLPHQIFDLKRLLLLDLSRNQLDSLSVKVEQLESLSQLYIESNKLTEIPEEIVNLNNLQNLSLDNNTIGSLPNLNSMHRLEYLRLEGNNLLIVDNNLALPNIKEINLNRNNISSIENEAFVSKKMHFLDLSENKLTELPICLASLPLRYLYIAHNPIEKEMQVLEQITTLQDLRIDKNQVDYLPNSIDTRIIKII